MRCSRTDGWSFLAGNDVDAMVCVCCWLARGCLVGKNRIVLATLATHTSKPTTDTNHGINVITSEKTQSLLAGHQRAARVPQVLEAVR